MDKDSKIYVAGHRGLVGSSIVRKLNQDGYNNLILRTSKELDLTNQYDVKSFFELEKPEYVFLCAAKVGGIGANSKYPVDFIVDNILIQTNVIKGCYEQNVKKMLFMGSSCIYPKHTVIPIKESELLNGYLEKTNSAYAVAKISGIEICQSYNKQYGTNYISVMPTNLYGINDNFDLDNSHMIPALIRKFHEAKISNSDSVEVWGSGNPLREILYVDDLADACLFLMDNYNESEIINVGVGCDLKIKDIANIIKDVIGYHGKIKFDKNKPDGTYRKLMDSSKINNLGWSSTTQLENGLSIVYDWYLKNKI